MALSSDSEVEEKGPEPGSIFAQYQGMASDSDSEDDSDKEDNNEKAEVPAVVAPINAAAPISSLKLNRTKVWGRKK